jgi:hypothetical protein
MQDRVRRVRFSNPCLVPENRRYRNQKPQSSETTMPGAVVTSTYRYKRPPRKKKAVALEVPAIVRAKDRRLGG